jgi:choline dehydrogenase-like flavoprotein
MQKAAKKVGLPVERDSNDPCGPAMGYFDLDMAINSRGERVSSMRAFLNKDIAIRRRSHLSVCTGVVASKLEIDGPKGLVTGIRIRSSKPTPGRPAEEYFVKARREVILSSGALVTPQLLMLSGIGPQDITKRLNIPLVKELPAVGANLADHVSFPVMLDLPKKETAHIMQDILWGIWYFLLWLFFGAGLLGSGTTPYSIFVRTGAINEKTMQVETEDGDGNDNMDASKSQNIPDVEIMVTGMNTFLKVIPKTTSLSLYTAHTQPRSRGRVELASVDPLAHPRVTLPHFVDQRDIESARIAMRFTMRVAEEFQNSGYPYPAPFLFAPGNRPELLAWFKSEATTSVLPDADPEDTGKTWRNVTDEEVDDYVTHVCNSTFHYGGTCSISNDESKGVVDQRLRVHGFKNLRIADASVIPKLVSVHTMAPTMMISQRCVSFIKEDWAWKGRNGKVA